MIDLMLASGNTHKAFELSKLLGDDIFTVNSAPEKLKVIESGKTYAENSLIKAKAYWNKYQTPIISDDSGINVSALPDELGIYSARFGGPGFNDQQKCQLLIEKLKNTPKEQRDAYFICSLCIYLNPKEIFFFEGRLHGVIADNIRGDHGFGYDPVFLPNELNTNQTIAENPQWKEKNSHRARACHQAIKFFKEKNCQN